MADKNNPNFGELVSDSPESGKTDVQKFNEEKNRRMAELLKRSTGIDISADIDRMSDSAVAKTPDRQPDISPVHTPGQDAIAHGVAETDGFMTEEDFVAMGGDPNSGREINFMENATKRADEIEEKREAANEAAMSDALKAAIEAEDERLNEAEQRDNDEDFKEKIFGSMPVPPAVTEAMASYRDRRRAESMSTNPRIDDMELMPAYDENEEDNAVPEAEEKEPKPGDDEYSDLIRNMAIGEFHDDSEPIVSIIRDRHVHTETSSRVKDVGIMNDQSFDNAISKYKKNNFGKVTVPLVNSGFMADMVGTGVVDLKNLYTNVDPNTLASDYQLMQMAEVIRNVTGTKPRVNPSSLSSMIHHLDFDILAYGNVCATIEKVESVTNCSECGKPFRISTPSNRLLLNRSKLMERVNRIQAAANIESVSLMARNRVITTDDGDVITLRHPSYAEKIRAMTGMSTYGSQMNPANRRRFESMRETLYMIQSVRLAGGLVSNNVYQHFRALTMLKTHDLEIINDEVESMNREVLRPEFGVENVVCPHCHKENHNIHYNSLIELVFFHFSLQSVLDQKPVQENGTSTEQK